jgi:stress response protein YsnF
VTTGVPDPVVLSAERAEVGIEWVVSGRARLRRRIVTETRSIEVVVRREELVIETENTRTQEDGQVLVGTSSDGPAVQDVGPVPELVIVLNEEVPQITMTTRPYEWVGVSVDLASTESTVTTPVRREEAVVQTTPVEAPMSTEGTL